MKHLTIVVLFFMISFAGFAQIAGNQAYGNSYNYSNQSSPQKQSVYTTDSTMVVSISILMNAQADCYLVTVGLNQEATTLKECNTSINSRIDLLKKALVKSGIASDIYVDFISQTRVYDHKIDGKQSNQIETGFEIKKNMVIRMKDLNKMDELVNICADQEVYDIIKVDYVNLDVNSTYERLYTEAMNLAESRKKLFLKTGGYKSGDTFRIVSDNFYSIYPKTQYRQYEAYESSGLTVYTNQSSSYVRKEARKNKTFYYEGVPVSGYDRIINADDPKVGIQYVFSMSVVYDISR